MDSLLRVIFLVFCVQITAHAHSSCVIELDCAECLPDNMPLVLSHRVVNGSVRAAAGDRLQLSCGGGRFLLYPQRALLAAVCEGARLRVSHDNQLRHLLDLGCQEDMFEDVLHAVDDCGSPLQGRAYQVQETVGGVRHLATLCYDEERALPVRARAAGLRAAGAGAGEGEGEAEAGEQLLPPHAHAAAPLSLFGNFNHMFDARTRHLADKLYSDDAGLQRRLRQALQHDDVALAGQTLTAARLLGAGYFDGRDARVADFPSNKFLAWASVAAGNLRHLQDDVADAVRARRLRVYAGTHAELAVRGGGGGRVRVRVAGGRRFPVPRYVWTVVLDARSRRGLALVVLNDPLVAVSEIKEAVFCESACSRAGWARRLLRARRYETPALGLTFCCHVRDFADRVPEMPRHLVENVPAGDDGLLTDISV